MMPLVNRIVRRCDRVFRGDAAARQLRKQLSVWRQNGAMIDPTICLTGRGIEASSLLMFGPSTIMEKDVTIWISQDPQARPTLQTGAFSFIGRNSYFAVFDQIRIGERALIGAYCYFAGANHGFSRRDVPIQQQPMTGGPIVVGDNAWLGAHVVVMPGTTIGNGAIVGASSVVTHDVPPFEIWAGSPARFIKSRP